MTKSEKRNDYWQRQSKKNAKKEIKQIGKEKDKKKQE